MTNERIVEELAMQTKEIEAETKRKRGGLEELKQEWDDKAEKKD